MRVRVQANVRTMAEPDVEGCLDLFEAVASEGPWLATEAPIDRRTVAEGWRALLSTGEGTVLLADEDGVPVGLAAMAGRRAPEMGMLVRADRRRQGVGQLLVAACVEWARSRGSAEVVLHVFPHNPAALALYRKNGFEERAFVPHAYRRRNGEKWDAIRMSRPLAPPPGALADRGDFARTSRADLLPPPRERRRRPA